MDEGTTPPASSPPSTEDAPTQKLTPSVMLGLLGAAGGSGNRSSSQRWRPPSVEELQKLLPQYEISAFIANGGMGAVYKGVQRTLKRTVAIKILPPDIEDGEAQYAARFKHEAQAMARLSHPNIVSVFDAGEVQSSPLAPREEPSLSARGERPQDSSDGTAAAAPSSSRGSEMATVPLLYFVMEFIEGTDVAQLIASEGRLDPRRAVPIITAVCEALAFAHEEGIIHRDIKPSNIMIDRKGRVKVADFGLAKTLNVESSLLTASNVAMGTPDFIAPEALIPGIAVDGRADLYAVGVMLYQMLTGKIPRGRFDSPSHVAAKVEKGFDAIVDKAMQTDRDRRYSTATALRTDVEKVAKKAGYGTASSPQPKEPPARSKALFVAAAAVLIVAIGGWAAFSAFSAKSPTPPTASAPEPAAIKLWDTPEKLPQEPGIAWENNAVRLDGRVLTYAAQSGCADMTVRASIQANPQVGDQRISLRRLDDAGGEESYNLTIDLPRGTINVRLIQGEVRRFLKTWPLSRAYQAGEWLRVEFQALGDALTVTLDGVVLGTVHDSTITKAGSVAVYASATGTFRDIEYVPLDKAAASASPNLPDSKSAPSDAAAKADAFWKSRWHQPGKLRAAGTDQNGKPFDLKAAEPYDDFVQVATMNPASSGTKGQSWAALRSNGEVIWSDGSRRAGNVGFVRFGGDVKNILAGGRVEIHVTTPPDRPVTDFSHASMHFLESKPSVSAWADTEGVWHLRGNAWDAGLMAKPDVTSLPKVTKVEVSVGGIGVLREDGSLRLWNTQEVRLPESLARDIRVVLSNGEHWSVLKTTGEMRTFRLHKRSAEVFQPLSEPIEEKVAGNFTNMVRSGWGTLNQRPDGSWVGGDVTTGAVLDQLHKAGNESFSVFRGPGGEGILWIEPEK